MLKKQTHRKAEETLELNFTQPRRTSSFKLPISIDGSWIIRLTSLEVYNSNFNKTEKKNNFALYQDPVNAEFVIFAIAIRRTGALLKMFYLVNWFCLAGKMKVFARVSK